MSLLVAGSSGFIGSSIADYLEFAGNNVIRTSNSTKSERASIRGDLSVPETLSIKKGGIDTIVHFAGDVSVRKFMDNPSLFSKNTEITRNLLEFARLNDIKLFLFASTDRVYGNAKGKTNEQSPVAPKELYAASKIAGEALCQAYSQSYGIDFIILRIANVYGPGQKPELFVPSIIRQAVTSNLMKVGNINVHRNFVYVKDVAKACGIMLKKKTARNNIINIAESAASLGTVIKMVSGIKKKHMGTSFRIEKDKTLVRPRRTEIGRFSMDCSKAHSLGWKPAYTLEKGLEETFLETLKTGGKN